MFVSLVQQNESVMCIHIPYSGHHSACSRVPCATPDALISLYTVYLVLFYRESQWCVCQSVSQFLPPTSCPLPIPTFILYVCVSMSALQIRSFLLFLSKQTKKQNSNNSPFFSWIPSQRETDLLGP